MIDSIISKGRSNKQLSDHKQIAVFPNLQDQLHGWVNKQFKKKGIFELSHGLLATLDSDNDLQNRPHIVTGHTERGFNTFSARIVYTDQTAFNDWRELWHQLSVELIEKVSDYLESQWQSNPISQPDIHLKSAPNTYVFLIGAAPINSDIWIKLEIVSDTTKLGVASARKSARFVDCPATLELAQVCIRAHELPSVEVGGLFVFGLTCSGQVNANLVLNSTVKSCFSVSWQTQTGEIMLNNAFLETYGATPDGDHSSQLIQQSVQQLSVPVTASIQVGRLSFDELNQLNPQQVLSTKIAVADCTVQLSANGQIFAEGVFVEINDQLCVRVTKVN
jgi:flagellar motor switch/type III secretory pathway protein FliN